VDKRIFIIGFGLYGSSSGSSGFDPTTSKLSIAEG
jgi:hypothetical protein